jgi:hypothetical protein
MTFGLCGAPNTFQGAMNETLAPLWRKSVLVFLMTSWSIAEHWMIISFTWKRSCYCCRKITSKSNFQSAQHKIAYLGHVISEAGVQADPIKIEAIQN